MDIRDFAFTKYTIIDPKQFVHKKDVTLNRQEFIEIVNGKEVLYNKGVKIGSIVRYKPNGRMYYLSYRTGEHFFIKFNGFGIDSGLIKKLVELKIDEIIIHYEGKRENRYYIANIDIWMLDGVKVNYQKDVGDKIETYGSQLILDKKKMKILGYDKQDYEIKVYKKRWILQ